MPEFTQHVWLSPGAESSWRLWPVPHGSCLVPAAISRAVPMSQGPPGSRARPGQRPLAAGPGLAPPGADVAEPRGDPRRAGGAGPGAAPFSPPLPVLSQPAGPAPLSPPGLRPCPRGAAPGGSSAPSGGAGHRYRDTDSGARIPGHGDRPGPALPSPTPSLAPSPGRAAGAAG